MSQRTFRMQKNFLIALLIQIFVPGFLLLIPFGYEWYTILFNYYNQEYNNIVVIAESFHGLVSTIVTICVHRPYRKGVMALISRQCGLFKSGSVQEDKHYQSKATVAPVLIVV
uniref:G_PROTEIN_RECEP_F1_2 domain-containing protein n=1 Tax=Caenorhabditis tropicalis TaxID=1561998 RepID=A0A1I7TY12_9PELO